MRRVLQFNHFGNIGSGAWNSIDAVIRSTARTIRDDAELNAPIDTGALKASLYVSTNLGSDYGHSADAAGALSRAGKSDAQVVAEVQPDVPHKAIIGSAVAHAVYNEFGSVTTPARPYLVPAVEAAADDFFRRIGEILQNVTNRNRPEQQESTETSEGAAQAAAATETAESAEMVEVAEIAESAPLLLL